MTRLKDKKRKPGSLVYFGGAVHEVLADGYTCEERRDLTPDSPKHLWRPKWTKVKAKRKYSKRSKKYGRR